MHFKPKSWPDMHTDLGLMCAMSDVVHWWLTVLFSFCWGCFFCFVCLSTLFLLLLLALGASFVNMNFSTILFFQSRALYKLTLQFTLVITVLILNYWELSRCPNYLKSPPPPIINWNSLHTEMSWSRLWNPPSPISLHWPTVLYRLPFLLVCFLKYFFNLINTVRLFSHLGCCSLPPPPPPPPPHFQL